MISKRVTVEVLPILASTPKDAHENRARTPPSAFLFLSLQLSNSHISRCREPDINPKAEPSRPLSEPAAKTLHTKTDVIPNPAVRQSAPKVPGDASTARPQQVAASPCVSGL
jgi:hypothetical protein